MNFRQFDLDYDKLIVDGFVIYKPNYMNITDWINNWKHISYNEQAHAVQVSYEKGVDEGRDMGLQENEETIDDLKIDLNNLKTFVSEIVEDEFYDRSELAEEINSRIQDIKDKI